MIAKPLRMAGWALTVVVLATLAGTLVLTGSPMEARRRRADQQRVSDLQQIVSMVRSYYGDKKKLPEKLADCNWYTEPRQILSDPGTGKAYEYRPVAKDRFEVFAEFETDTTKKPAGYAYYGGYDLGIDRHAKGRVCFAFPAKQ